jgi:hypothetical protein
VAMDPTIESGFGPPFESAWTGPIIRRVSDTSVANEFLVRAFVPFGPTHFLTITYRCRIVCQSILTGRVVWEMEFSFDYDTVARTPDGTCLCIARTPTVYIIHLSPNMIPSDIVGERVTTSAARPSGVGSTGEHTATSASRPSSRSASHRVYIFDPPAPMVNPPPIFHLYALD